MEDSLAGEGALALPMVEGLNSELRTVVDPALPVGVAEELPSEQQTAENSLCLEEIERARNWAGFISCLCFLTTMVAPLLGNPGAGRNLFIFSMLLLGMVSMWVFFRCRRPEKYTARVFRVFGYTAVTISLCVEWYLGVFSPTVLVVTLGIMFFGLGLDRFHALAICLLAVVGYSLLCIGTMAGWIPDSDVMPAAGRDTMAMVYFTFVGPFVMLGSLWMARVSRRSMDEAMDRTIRAIHLMRQKEAQLAEVRQDLNQALHLGKGHPGRFTGYRAGSFLLDVVIGRGGMGEVYRARDEETGEDAAVKVLREHAFSMDNHLRRFLREGEIAGGFQSENIVRVLGVGVIGEQLPYIAMELLKGKELSQWLRDKGRLETSEVKELVRQVSRGLDEAHGAGVIHRDLKPQNLFYCEPEGRWKILDFGVSKNTGKGHSLTLQGSVIGTPGYMAPEQATGGHVDIRADVFVLGAVVYRCLTGRQPFIGPDAPAVMFEIVYGVPPKPSELNPQLHPSVDEVILRAMEKDPMRRYQSVGAFAAALHAVLSNAVDEPVDSQPNSGASEKPIPVPSIPDKRPPTEKVHANAELVDTRVLVKGAARR